MPRPCCTYLRRRAKLAPVGGTTVCAPYRRIYAYQPGAYVPRTVAHHRSRLCADDPGFDFERWRLHTSPSHYIRLLGGSIFGVTFRWARALLCIHTVTFRWASALLCRHTVLPQLQ